MESDIVMPEDFWIAMALAIIFRVLKDPHQVMVVRRALRKLRDALDSLPLDDQTK